MICPECSSPDVRESRSSRMVDVFQRARGRIAYRCRRCRHRFYASPGSDNEISKGAHRVSRHSKRTISSRGRRRLVRKIILFSVFAIAFLIFWLFLRYLTKEPSPDGSPSQIVIPVSSSTPRMA